MKYIWSAVFSSEAYAYKVYNQIHQIFARKEISQTGAILCGGRSQERRGGLALRF